MSPAHERAIELVRAGHSFGRAAASVGLTRNAVAGVCWRAGVHGSNSQRPSMRAERAPRPPGRDWGAILKSAKERGLSPSEVATEQGVSRAAVSKAQTRCGIRLGRNNKWLDILNKAKARGVCVTVLAREIGVAYSTARKMAKYHTIWEFAYPGRGW